MELIDKQLKIVEDTKEFVKHKLSCDSTGHDWWHAVRVYRAAKFIAKEEKADIFIVELSSLLHDIADWKFTDGNLDKGPDIARNFLSGKGVSPESLNKITSIIRDISFRGNNADKPELNLEGMVVQDADRLDALGAIGIARTFAYGGYRGNKIHDPEIKPRNHDTFEEYRNSRGTTVNHFYEKLLLLKDMMNTETGRILAEKRHKYMEMFLEEFYSEWNAVF